VWGKYFMLILSSPNSGGNLDMIAEKQDSDYYTVEVARDLPLSEQLHKANIQICHDINANEKVFLEDIQFRNGYRVLRYRFWRDESGRR
jgi:hypothetical protein